MLERWRAVLGEVPGGPASIDWRAVEAELGTALPTDYRVYADNYPALCVEGFLHVSHPVGEWALREAAEAALVPLRGHREEFPEFVPYALFPEPGGLLPWGITDNGDDLFWSTEGDPDDWRVVVSDHAEWWTHDGGVLSFLSGLLRREIECPLLPRLGEPGYEVRAD
ncbi:hypothetical protein [Lentzea sp. NPDC055074]